MAKSEKEIPITTQNQEPSKFLKRFPPWLSALIAIISVIVAALALIRGECHYSELTKPQARLEEIRVKLVVSCNNRRYDVSLCHEW